MTPKKLSQATVGLHNGIVRNLRESYELEWEEAKRDSEMVKRPLNIAFLSPLRC